MVTPKTKPISFEEFLRWCPQDNRRYELIEGVIVEMPPTGSHEDVSGFIVAELNIEIHRQNLPYSIPKSCLIKPIAPRSGYIPDVAVIDREQIVNELLWQTSSVIENGKTIPLVIEVVSTNWRDDYGHKFVEYEAMGIKEYWIVEGLSGESNSPACKPRDYRALGAVRHIGKPKQPTVTICKLIEEEYQVEKFVKGDRLKSSVFPELNLSTEAIFEIGTHRSCFNRLLFYKSKR